MRMMAVLQDPDRELDDLERTINGDLGLSERLLRWINSAYFLLPRRVGSVREAVGAGWRRPGPDGIRTHPGRS